MIGVSIEYVKVFLVVCPWMQRAEEYDMESKTFHIRSKHESFPNLRSALFLNEFQRACGCIARGLYSHTTISLGRLPRSLVGVSLSFMLQKSQTKMAQFAIWKRTHGQSHVEVVTSLWECCALSLLRSEALRKDAAGRFHSSRVYGESFLKPTLPEGL